MSTKRPADIIPGDTWRYRQELPLVTALRPAEPHSDMFGRPMLKIWAAAEGREGYIIYGPEASITLEEGAGQA